MMEFNQQEANQNSIISFDEVSIILAHSSLEKPCFISSKYFTNIDIDSIEQLDKELLFSLSHHDDIDILIIGTGKTSKFLHPKKQIEFQHMGIGVECMKNESAYHCFNLLLSDQRKVGLLVI